MSSSAQRVLGGGNSDANAAAPSRIAKRWEPRATVVAIDFDLDRQAEGRLDIVSDTVAFEGDYAPWRDVFSVSSGYFVLPRHVLGRLAADPTIERIHLVVSAGASQVLRHELGPEKTGAADPHVRVDTCD